MEWSIYLIYLGMIFILLSTHLQKWAEKLSVYLILNAILNFCLRKLRMNMEWNVYKMFLAFGVHCGSSKGISDSSKTRNLKSDKERSTSTSNVTQ